MGSLNTCYQKEVSELFLEGKNKSMGFGLNMKTKCVNKACQYYREEIWVKKGFGQFEIKQLYKEKCPFCHHKIKHSIISFGIIHCRCIIESQIGFQEGFERVHKIPNFLHRTQNLLPFSGQNEHYTIPFQTEWNSSFVKIKKITEPTINEPQSSCPSSTISSMSHTSFRKHHNRFVCSISHQPILEFPVYYFCKGCNKIENYTSNVYELSILKKAIQEGKSCGKCEKLMTLEEISRSQDLESNWVRYMRKKKMKAIQEFSNSNIVSSSKIAKSQFKTQKIVTI